MPVKADETHSEDVKIIRKNLKDILSFTNYDFQSDNESISNDDNPSIKILNNEIQETTQLMKTTWKFRPLT